MKYGVFSANEWLYPDSCPEQGKREISLLAPGNSFACTQIFCLCDGPLSCQWLPEGNLAEPELNRLLPVYVDKNTDCSADTVVVPQGTPLDYITRPAPFHVFDAMETLDCGESLQPEDGAIALYLRFPTKGKTAGTYHGTLRLTCGDETADIPVALTIAPVEIPAVETLRLTNWYSLPNMATYHGLEPWSEAHWDKIAEYGKIMREGRQTDFRVTITMADHSLREDGSHAFDFSRIERFIRLYLSLGFRYIEGPHIAHRLTWDDPIYQVSIDGKDVPTLSDEGIAYLHDFCTAWYAFLQKNGWTDIATQHISDEPIASSARDYATIARMVRQWIPGVKTIDATDVVDPIFIDLIDIPVPRSDCFLKSYDSFVEHQKKGGTIWLYTCCYPGGWHLNRFLDQELVRTRYLHWANYLYKMPGYLHWGLNQYQASGGGMFAGACDRTDGPVFPSGDSHILYVKGEKILRSARYEMMRAGCEDYELFQMAAKKDPEKAAAILAQCVRSLTDYTTDITVFEEAYAQLLTLAE